MLKNFVLQKQFFVANHQLSIKQYYQKERKLGGGTFGTVYKVRQLVFPRQVRAVKSISKKRVKNPKSVLRQVKIMSKLDHPSIMKIYETFEDEQYLYIVMDYCAGGELYHRLARTSKFNEALARHLFGQMVRAIKYMHNSRVAHRDIKLQNFVLAAQDSWDVVLIDFGLSFGWEKDMRTDMKAIGENLLTGTAYYVAPEVINGDYDERCDIWSLGVLLYMMLTGTPPFLGNSDIQILENVAKSNFSLKTKECQKLSQGVIQLINLILKPQQKRISLDGILAHPWMNQQSSFMQQPLRVNFDNLINFTKLSKLKKVVSTYIATHLSQSEIQELRDLFHRIDKNQDGTLSFQELKSFLNSHSDYNESLIDLGAVMDGLDTNSNQRIDYNQFISACLSESLLLNEKYLRYVFDSFDLKKDGRIQREEFNMILRSYCQDFRCNEQLVQELMGENDNNKDGFLDYTQFSTAMTAIAQPKVIHGGHNSLETVRKSKQKTEIPQKGSEVDC